MRSWTREQQNAAWRKWYAKNAARKYAWQERRRRRLRAWFQELKSQLRCEICGETAPECLHFHHRDPSEKDLEVGTAACQGWSRDRLLAEIAKCSVLCANCHLKHHWDDEQT